MTVLTERPGRQPKPEFEPEKKTKGMLAVFFLVVTVPLLALVAAVPVAWGWGLTWTDVAIAVGFYVFCGLGVTVGTPVEALYREVRALRIYEGASEVQKVVIARQHLAQSAS